MKPDNCGDCGHRVSSHVVLPPDRLVGMNSQATIRCLVCGAKCWSTED